MNVSPKPKTPIRTPQAGSSLKALQLTPIWEEVVKNNRLPPNINEDLIFKEIAHRLEDLEWPVRQHAFRVLSDIIPVLPTDKLDEAVIDNDILKKLIINLGHSAPGVRKIASETIQKYLKRSGQTENMLENFIRFGVQEIDFMNVDEIEIPRENITLGTISSLPDILRPFIQPENGGYCITQSSLAKIVEAVAVKINESAYRDGCFIALWKLRKLTGKQRFSQALKNVAERDRILEAMNFFEEQKISPLFKRTFEEWNDDTNSFEEKSDERFNLPNRFERPRKRSGRCDDISYIVSNESSEEYTDNTDTETYTKEPVPSDPDFYRDHSSELIGSEEANDVSLSFVPIDKCCMKNVGESTIRKEESPNSLVLLEAEFQLTQNKAIKMKVTREDESDSFAGDNPETFSPVKKRFIVKDDDVIMNFENDINTAEAEDRTKTPKRVHFGGEVVKLRTPESDTTDITADIYEPDEKFGKEPDDHGEIMIIKEEAEGETSGPETEEKRFELKSLSASEPTLPSAPTTVIPRDNMCSSKKKDSQDGDHVKIESPGTPLKTETPMDSLQSSSGSDTEFKDCRYENGDFDYWSWSKLGLVEDNIIKDLENKGDWKIQYNALEHLKSILKSPKTIDRIGKIIYKDELNSLFKCLLCKLPENTHQQVVNLALSLVSKLVDTLPYEITLACVPVIVQGLCRYLGGSKNIHSKIESAHCLRLLFEILEPSSIINVLLSERCLFSKFSKLRENALLGIIIATMTFPSTYFDVDTILERVTDSAIDCRRRVRHAALEAIAVLSQYCSAKAVTDNVSRVADKLPTIPPIKTQFMTAVQARLSRRLLPSISSEGLVLYALQIPASRRFGVRSGNGTGADIDWILSGTGSLSTGSAKSKPQLNAAPRLNVGLTAPLSPRRWVPSERPLPSPTRISGFTAKNKSCDPGNPWTVHKNRNESSITRCADQQDSQKPPAFQEDSPIQLCSSETDAKDEENEKLKEHEKPRAGEDMPLTYQKKNFRAEDITWALVPLAALEETQPDGEKNPNFYNDSLKENGFGSLRPLYLKLQPTSDQLIFSKSSDDVRKFLSSFEGKKNSDGFNRNDVTEVRLMTPSIVRDKNLESSFQNFKRTINDRRGHSKNPTKIPMLMNNQKNLQTDARKSAYRQERKLRETTEVEFSNALKRSCGINNYENGLSTFPAFLPTISSQCVQAEDIISHNKQKSNINNKHEILDETKFQDPNNHISGGMKNSKLANKSTGKIFSVQDQVSDENLLHDCQEEKFLGISDENDLQVTDQVFIQNHQEHLPMSVASAPAMISTEPRGHTPSTSSSNSTDCGVFSGSELRRRLGSDSCTASSNNRLSYKNFRTCDSKQTEKKSAILRSKIGSNKTFPDTLKPFDRPKEALDTCFSQLESQQWEVNMLGLTSYIRLLRHHPAVVLSQIHLLMVALGHQIRNLRSQVARAACQASAETFLILKRNVEPDLDELSVPLFHRAADTNRFIRADCNDALDNMIDNISHGKAVVVIVSKGATHQNAVVRAVAGRLLLRLSERVGHEKLLSLPKEIRDKMLQTGANFLLEGKLETRAFAKQVFRIWSSHPSFSNLILEAIPPNVMRHISKTLTSLKS